MPTDARILRDAAARLLETPDLSARVIAGPLVAWFTDAAAALESGRTNPNDVTWSESAAIRAAIAVLRGEQ